MPSEQKSKAALTLAQQEAVEHIGGPVAVIAGAGCGKTLVLTERIAHLIGAGACRPDEILAVTYTINAAAEIRERVARMLPDLDCSQLKAMTFHSYCTGVLAQAGKKFAVVDDTDLKVYLRQHIEELPLKYFTRAASPAQFIDHLLKFNGRCQDELVTAADFARFVQELREKPLLAPPRVAKPKDIEKYSREDLLDRCEEIAAVYTHVSKLLKAKKWGTFGDLIQSAVALLRKDPALLAAEQARCRFILIDEFQDSNHAQMELASLLGGAAANIFVVGDPDQAIYKFRGATAAAFEEFVRRYPHCHTVVLEQNFRSTPAILTTAHAFIGQNPAPSMGRKPLQPARSFAGPTAAVEALITKTAHEAWAVAETLERRQAATGQPWSDFAVLYRNHDHREEVVEELRERGIPMEVVGADLLETTDLRDLLAAARAVVRPDDSVSLMRAAALPCFAIDQRALKQAMAHAERNTPLVRTLESVQGGTEVLALRNRAQERTKKTNAAAALEIVRTLFGLPLSSPAEQLLAMARSWPEKPICEDRTLAGFIEYLDLFREAGGRLEDEDTSEHDAVQLMTVHAAKGLEFADVFVLKGFSPIFPSGFREDLFEFPAALARTRYQEVDAKVAHEEEQRRLYYVAMTRAQDRLSICSKPKQKGVYSGACADLLAMKELQPVLGRRDVTSIPARLEAVAAPVLRIEEWLAQPAQRWQEGIVLSASAIESYKNCPLQFKLERDWKIPAETGAALQYGSAMHLTLKAYFDAVKAGRRLTLEQLLATFEDSMEAAAMADEHQGRLYRQQGRVHLAAFHGSRDGQEPEVLATEQRFEVTVRGMKIIGRMDRIDRVEGGVHIVDYKTGKAKNDTAARKSLQLGIYALAAREQKMNPLAVSFHNLEDNTVVTVTKTAADMVEVEDEIVKVGEEIKAGHFAPKPGFQCKSCAFRSLCPAHEQKNLAIAKAVATVQ